MTDASLVSVILPAFNRAATLERSARSVLAQTHRNLELIVVDDASTDGTADLATRWGDPRVRLVRRKTRGGPGAARNSGLAQARGEWIAFQDSDDAWLPEKITRQVMQLGAADGSVGMNVCAYREDGVGSSRPFLPNEGGDALRQLLAGRNFITPTWLVRRTALERAGRFDEDLPSCEDYDLAFRLLDVAAFQLSDDVLVVKTSSAQSVYNDPARRAEGRRLALEKHRQRWHGAPALLAAQERTVGSLLLRSGRRAEGLRYLARAALHDPAGQLRFAAQWLRRQA